MEAESGLTLWLRLSPSLSDRPANLAELGRAVRTLLEAVTLITAELNGLRATGAFNRPGGHGRTTD
jgi:hypothetical protein